MADVMQTITKNLLKKNGDCADKSVVNVMVFYSDNSFDLFVPNK